MAQRVVTTLVRRWAGLPVVVRIAVIYIAARLVTTGFLWIAAAQSGPFSRFGADATLGSFVLGWDAQWYWSVAVYGYPSELPLSTTGQISENAWAFLPVYAYLAQIVGFLLGSWGAGAFLISIVSGFFACLVLHRLLRRRIGSGAALWAVVFFASGPLAALFQVGYAESLFLLLLFLALDAVARRSFWPLYLLVPLLAFTRPGVLAFALFLALYGILRWVRRQTDPLPMRQIAHIIVIGLLSAVLGFAWQQIAAFATGVSGAYLETELSWRRNWLPGTAEQFVPFDGWIQAAQFWLSAWGLPGWGIPVLVVLVLVVAALLLFSSRVRLVGAEIRLWSASYLLYLLAVFFPQSSLFRLLLPVSPLWGAVAVRRSRAFRIGVLGLCLIGQWLWIWAVYALGNAYWQVP